MKIRITKTPYSFGGELNTQGADFNNGLLEVNNGGRHEENPLEGVPMGADQEGTPNVVEEGETIYEDYVFSNRILVPDELKKKYKLGGGKDMTFADASKKLAKESSERPNDPISSLALKKAMADLRDAQEEVKAREQEAKMQTANTMLQSLGLPSLEEMAAQQQMAQQQAYEQGLAEQQDPYAQQQASLEEMAAQQQMAQQQAYEQGLAEQQIADTYGYAYGGGVNRFNGGGYVLNVETKKIEWSETATSDNPGEGYTWVGNNSDAKNQYRAQQVQEWLDGITLKDTSATTFPLYANAEQVLTDALGLTNRPSYYEANMIEGASDASYLPVSGGMIGNRLFYRPTDRNWALNAARASDAAQRRALLQNAGLNRGVATNALLANRAAYTQGLGAIAHDADDANWERRKDAADFNRTTDIQNVQTSLASQQYNQGAYATAKSRRLTGMTSAATQRYKERTDTDTAKGQNKTNLISSIGEYGKQNQAYNDRLIALRSGAFGSVRPQDSAALLHIPAPTIADPETKQSKAKGGSLRSKKRKITKKWL